MKRRFRTGTRARQSGVALIVALVVLVIIGLTSAAVMRGALTSDLVTNNTRVQALASQAAQVALRYCEDQWDELGTAVITLPAGAPGDDMAWENFANWGDAGMVSEVPVEYMQSALSSFKPDKLPQCIVQWSTVGGADALVITARGFSPDFRETADTHATEAGSVVWLQYILAY